MPKLQWNVCGLDQKCASYTVDDVFMLKYLKDAVIKN